jgi:hypothetical protein
MIEHKSSHFATSDGGETSETDITIGNSDHFAFKNDKTVNLLVAAIEKLVDKKFGDLKNSVKSLESALATQTQSISSSTNRRSSSSLVHPEETKLKQDSGDLVSTSAIADNVNKTDQLNSGVEKEIGTDAVQPDIGSSDVNGVGRRDSKDKEKVDKKVRVSHSLNSAQKELP